ncbi:type IV conjugative transfer system protein TraL [Cronobacter dublinensis subsp. dublinensis]|nr:type IV conjugative transfer system protein TraL [Cronobacter dublinensis subsp. dublinensis]EGT5729759.1 type IV conjugative transfer system protein TraL [Cronobacter dublinensis subsp. dublinensis]
MEPIVISHSVDDPPKFFFWSIDEAMPFFIMLMAGIFTGRILTFCLIGIVITRYYGSFLQRASEKYFLHLIYWNLGISFGKSTIVPNSFEREFIV